MLVFAGGCGRSEGATEQGSDPGVVNVYTARHYDTDDALYARFTEVTGIRVNLIEADADQLIARIEREGDLSPADVLIVVDAARLHRAEAKSVFSPVASEQLDQLIPTARRHPDGLWFGLTERVRVIVASNDRVSEDAPNSYEDLADPRWQGRLLVRSSSNVYNQSLVAGMIESIGAEATQAWCEGVVANFARTPQGGDTDQIRAVAAGVGDLALVNHYYLARMLAGDGADLEAASGVRVIFPNQGGRGAHVNICGAGVVRSAPNRANAIALLEFLADDEAQAALAAGNFEYPVKEGVTIVPIVEDFGAFEAEGINVSTLGRHNAEAVRVMDRAGWR